jgi:hypothetical protein
VCLLGHAVQIEPNLRSQCPKKGIFQTSVGDYRNLTHQPKAVGAISHRGKSYSAHLHMPADALGPMLQMMIAGRYRYVLIEAHKSYRGEALVRHFGFAEAISDEDFC